MLSLYVLLYVAALILMISGLILSAVIVAFAAHTLSYRHAAKRIAAKARRSIHPAVAADPQRG